jgi:integrase
MPTKRVELGKQHVEEALAAAAARTYTSGNPLVFVHVKEDGLQLRVQGGSANWYVRFNGKTKSIGKLTVEPTIPKAITAAVERGRHVRALMERGDDPDRYLKTLKVEKDHGIAAADAESQKARAAGAWTYADLRAAYRAEHKTQPQQKNGVLKPVSSRSVADYDAYSQGPHHKDLIDDMLVRDLTPELIEEVRDRTRQSNGPDAGRKVVTYISSTLSWGQKEYKRHTGLGTGFSWWRAVSTRHVPGKRNRYLTLEQIARVLYVAEKYRQLPNRGQPKPTSDAALAALWWIVLSGQRTGASMKLLSSRIIPYKEQPGWMIVAFPATDMKSRRYHALPVPPGVALLFKRAKIGVNRETAWAFPSAKLRRNNSEEIVDMNVHDSIVGQLIQRLRGKDDVARKRALQDKQRVAKGKQPLGAITDLLEGIPEFSPHDLRRSLATILTNMKVRGDAASAVLDHSSKTPNEQEFQEADITRLAYNLSQRLELKSEAMEIWTNAVFEAVEAEWAKNHRVVRPVGTMRRVVPPSPEIIAKLQEDRQKCIFTAAGPWYQFFKGKEQPRGLNLRDIRNRIIDFEPDDEVA